MTIEYRLKPSSHWIRMYWLQRRFRIGGIPLWWADVDFSSEKGCWEKVDEIRLKEAMPNDTKYIYEEDRV